MAPAHNTLFRQILDHASGAASLECDFSDPYDEEEEVVQQRLRIPGSASHHQVLSGVGWVRAPASASESADHENTTTGPLHPDAHPSATHAHASSAGRSRLSSTLPAREPGPAGVRPRAYASCDSASAPGHHRHPSAPTGVATSGASGGDVETLAFQARRAGVATSSLFAPVSGLRPPPHMHAAGEEPEPPQEPQALPTSMHYYATATYASCRRRSSTSSRPDTP